MSDGFFSSHSFLTNPSLVRSSASIFADTGASAYNSLLFNNNISSSSHSLSNAYDPYRRLQQQQQQQQQPSNTVSRIANDLLKLHKSTSCIRRSASMATSQAHGFSGYNGQSEIETAILRSNEPIEITETEEISALGHRGIWANKSESTNWRGPIPLSNYQINQDNSPELINKKSQQNVEYVQELAIRYLILLFFFNFFFRLVNRNI